MYFIHNMVFLTGINIATQFYSVHTFRHIISTTNNSITTPPPANEVWGINYIMLVCFSVRYNLYLLIRYLLVDRKYLLPPKKF